MPTPIGSHSARHVGYASTFSCRRHVDYYVHPTDHILPVFKKMSKFAYALNGRSYLRVTQIRGGIELPIDENLAGLTNGIRGAQASDDHKTAHV